MTAQLLCTLQQVRKMIGIGDEGTNTEDDSLIEDVLIPAARDMINNDVQFTFGTLIGSLELFARHPYLKGNTLYFRDNAVTAIDSLSTDNGTLTPGVDYILQPLNFSPKTSALLANWDPTSITNTFGTLTLHGTLGYGSIPSDVNFAATKLAAWMYLTRDSEGNVEVVGDVTQVPAQAPPMVHKLLGKYKLNLLFA
jgi:hypothetical protein